MLGRVTVTFLRVRRPKLQGVLATVPVSDKLFVCINAADESGEMSRPAYVKDPMAVENCIIAPAKVCRNSTSSWNEVGG